MTSPHRPRALRAIVALAVAPLALVACGGDDDDATTSTDAVVTTDVEAATTAAADTTTPATTAAADATTPDGAVTFTSDEGDYSATFPGEPSLQTQPQPLPDGNTVDIVLATYEVEDGFMATARGQYPDGYVLDVPVALQGAQDQALANVSGTLTGSQDITLQGRPGREFTATITSGGETGTLLQRVYLDGLVIYQQVFTGAGDVTFADPTVAPFFESFAFATG